MLILSTSSLLVNNATTLRRILCILFNRVTIILLLGLGTILCEAFYASYIETGFGVFSGLFHSTAITDNFGIFIYWIGGIILLLTAFYPRWIEDLTITIKRKAREGKEKLISLLSNLNPKKYLVENYKKMIMGVDGPLFLILEYPLVILFILLGAVSLMTSSDVVTMFLAIELQSYGLYILVTLNRDSEWSTSSGLTYFLLGGLSSCFIVRQCVFYSNGSNGSEYFPNVLPASELGEGESPEPNIASPLEGKIRPNWEGRLAYRAESTMTKVILLEAYSLGVPSRGRSLAQDRWHELRSVEKWTTNLRNSFYQGTICTHNVKSVQSKVEQHTIKGTLGLPKDPKGLWQQRDRSTVLAKIRIGGMNICTGRRPGLQIRSMASAAGGSSTVSTDSVKKLQKINNLCTQDPNFKVTDKLYKLMYDPQLYLVAYQKLRSKPGNMTPGITPVTLDGMSDQVMPEIIGRLRAGTFKFSPGRRIDIPKANGGERPLTIAPPRDKLVQEVIRMILEAIYEPSFMDTSHGFRPGKSCHSALKEIHNKFGVANWYIEGDISKCFDTIPHERLMGILGERITDYRFLDLIRKALKAGYMENTTYRHTLVGTPQGSIISPILCNIYMDRLDRYVGSLKEQFDTGTKASRNPEWHRYNMRKHRSKTLEEKLHWHRKMMSTPSKLNIDPKFKRLVYVRYADDWIIGIRGSRQDCLEILTKIKTFLNEEMKLQLSEAKTLITNAKLKRALFLGTEIYRASHNVYNRRHGYAIRANKEIRMNAPIHRVTKKLTESGFIRLGRSYPKFIWLARTKDEILILYNSVYRGITQYYRFANNFNRLSAKVHYILKSSCAKLLAAKFNLKTQAKVYKKFGRNLAGGDKHGFCPIVLGVDTWKFNAETQDPILKVNAAGISKASLEDLSCSSCESKDRVEMHHVRMMKDLNPKAFYVDKIMAQRNRKQIPLCRKCHLELHRNKAEAAKKDNS